MDNLQDIFSVDTEQLATKLAAECYAIPTSTDTRVKGNIYINGIHKYMILLMGCKHISGERLLTFKDVRWGMSGPRVGDATIVVNDLKLSFFKREFEIIVSKGLAKFDGTGSGIGGTRYRVDSNTVTDIFLTSLGWTAFGYLIPDFMMDPTSYVEGTGRMSAAAAAYEVVDGTDVADMARFAHIDLSD